MRILQADAVNEIQPDHPVSRHDLTDRAFHAPADRGPVIGQAAPKHRFAGIRGDGSNSVAKHRDDPTARRFETVEEPADLIARSRSSDEMGALRSLARHHSDDRTLVDSTHFVHCIGFK
jgi:hypothetical protein